MALPESKKEREEMLRSLKDKECVRIGDKLYCREGEKLESFAVEEERLSTSETAIIGLVLAILGAILLPLPFIGIAAALLAVIFSGIGVYETRRFSRRGYAIALAGLIIGAISIALFIVLVTNILYLSQVTAP